MATRLDRSTYKAKPIVGGTDSRLSAVRVAKQQEDPTSRKVESVVTG